MNERTPENHPPQYPPPTGPPQYPPPTGAPQYPPPTGAPLYPSPTGAPQYPPTGVPQYPPPTGAPTYLQGGYPGYPPAPFQPPRKRRWPWALGVSIFVVVGLVGVLSFEDFMKPSMRTLVYEVVGSGGPVDISYTDRGFNSTEQRDASLPWTKEVTIDLEDRELLRFVFLSANGGPEDGPLTCKISANGVTLDQTTASGPYPMLGCMADANDA